MADAASAGALRSSAGMGCLHLWKAIFRQGSWILRIIDYDYIAWDLCFHALPDTGSDGGDVSDSRLVFFSDRVRAGRTVALALLGIGCDDGVERFDKKPYRDGVSDCDYFCFSLPYW